MARQRLLLTVGIAAVMTLIMVSPLEARADGGADCSAAFAAIGCPEIGAGLDAGEAVLEAVRPGRDAPVVGEASSYADNGKAFRQ